MAKLTYRLFSLLTAAALCTVSAVHVLPIQTAGAYSDDYYYDDDGEPYLIRWDYNYAYHIYADHAELSGHSSGVYVAMPGDEVEGSREFR